MRKTRIALVGADRDLGALASQLQHAGFVVVLFSALDETALIGDPAAADCIVADIDRSTFDGGLALALARAGSRPLIVVGDADIALAVQAIRLGAADYLPKPVRSGQAIAAIVRGTRHAQPQPAAAVNLKAVVAGLSKREQDVFALSALGKTSREVGLVLGISARTVEVHRASINRKRAQKTPRHMRSEPAGHRYTQYGTSRPARSTAHPRIGERLPAGLDISSLLDRYPEAYEHARRTAARSRHLAAQLKENIAILQAGMQKLMPRA